jgi:DNA-directed RNA polymerase specialized sigma24 family protein
MTAAPIDIGSEWPWVRAQVLRTLSGRQVPSADAEDIIQEVALRALARPTAFATREDLARWSWRVAWRLRIDATRRDKRLAAEAPPDVAGPDDTARLVEGRMAVETALAGVASLSAADRAALFAVTGPEASRQDAVRLAVRRHRARARLRRAIGFAGAWLGWVAVWARRLRQTPVARAALVAPVLLAVAAEVGVTLLVPTPRVRPPAPAAIRTPAPQEARLDVRVPVGGRGGSGPAGTGGGRPHVDAGSTIAVVPLGDRTSVRVGSDERPDPPTACVENFPVVDDVCVDRPGGHVPLPVLDD